MKWRRVDKQESETTTETETESQQKLPDCLQLVDCTKSEADRTIVFKTMTQGYKWNM